MPYFPTVAEINTTKQLTDVFRGYNHNPKIADGEWYDMQNLCSDHYPLLSTRHERGVYASPASCQGLIAKDALCWVDGAAFYINGAAVQGLTLSTLPADCPKTLLSMGAYVIIMPDKMYVNTADLTDYGSMEAAFTTQADVTFTLCDIEGNDYENASVSDTAPQDPANMDYWIDTSGTVHVLKQWSSNSSMWVSVPTTYVKISSAGIGASFAQYDGVSLSGITVPQLADINGTATVWARGADYIVVVGILDEAAEQSGSVAVSRTVPNMDFMTEAGNRLWGCRYGTAANGEIVNEIYACKLGDFKNWNSFMGLSTDSYVASCGTDGPFTGAITHLGYPLFWKEGYLHKVYGNQPSNYQVQSTVCRGVQRGCGRSLAIVNEVLFYMGRNGVCAYDGSLPGEISSAFGGELYSDAVGGSHNNKYYLSAKDSAGVWQLFLYDAKLKMWHREDSTRADAWCSCRNEMYYIDHADGKIKTVLGSGTAETVPVTWYAESGTVEAINDYIDQVANRKYVSRMQIRMELTPGAEMTAYIQYDSGQPWEKLWTMRGKTLQSFSIPIRPRRCDHFRIRLEGVGAVKIYSITKSVETGSDEE